VSARSGVEGRNARADAAAVGGLAAGAGCGAGAGPEPKAYTSLPIGLNFLVAGYAQGGLSTAPSLPLEDAHVKTDFKSAAILSSGLDESVTSSSG
jgi:hypothetical protein